MTFLQLKNQQVFVHVCKDEQEMIAVPDDSGLLC